MREQLELKGKKFDWSDLLETALTVPGSLGNTYSRFKPGGYSFGNQILLWYQGCQEPVNTYKRWADMGRQVAKGSKAKAIFVPIMRKVETEDGQTVSRVARFKLVNCLFGVSETTGDELPEVQPEGWDRTRALGALSIRQVPFTQHDGDMAGYSFGGNNIAINPVAKYPMKTTIHECAHCVLDHSSDEFDYVKHRGLAEFEAEGTAYLVMNELELGEAWDASESRAYVQNWLRGDRPDDKSIKRVFSATTKILQAGRAPAEVQEAA